MEAERIVMFADNGQATAWLREHTQPGDAVLLKGSRKYKMEEIIQELHA
jgi:UDP-N-acetylmuramyl pentapeptide synthase